MWVLYVSLWLRVLPFSSSPPVLNPQPSQPNLALEAMAGTQQTSRNCPCCLSPFWPTLLLSDVYAGIMVSSLAWMSHPCPAQNARHWRARMVRMPWTPRNPENTRVALLSASYQGTLPWGSRTDMHTSCVHWSRVKNPEARLYFAGRRNINTPTGRGVEVLNHINWLKYPTGNLANLYVRMRRASQAPREYDPFCPHNGWFTHSNAAPWTK